MSRITALLGGGDDRLKDALSRIGEDLFAIEVNTIVKPTMTACRFPGGAHAVLDIAAEYDCYLAEFAPTGTLPRRVPGSSGSRKVSAQYFDGMRDHAKELLTGGFANDSSVRRRLLARVIDNCDQVKPILTRNARGTDVQGFTRADAIEADEGSGRGAMPTLKSADLVILRKIWEVGLEEIAMQTVVHLDGDVITRLQPEHASGGSPGILVLHEKTTQVALGYWKDLVGIAAQVVKAALGLATG